MDRQVIVIGRGTDCLIFLPHDSKVSRHHAEVRRQSDGGYGIRDLGSHNGTLVNGAAVTQRPLKDGDAITIGDTKITFSI